MFSIRKINPMVRAIGAMGAIAAVVGGITFAQIPSNTVTLANNTLSSATATLGIGLTSDCSDQSIVAKQGMVFNNLLPNVASSPFTFCLDNTGNTPLGVTAATTTDFTGSAINPNDVTLSFLCGADGAADGSAVNTSFTVGSLVSPQAFDGALNNSTNNVLTCQVTATLDGNVTTSNASLTPFDIDFSGTSS